MSELVRMCECGGRTLLDGETLCPSCQRAHKSVGWQLQKAKIKVEVAGGAAGHTGTVLIGRAMEQARIKAHAIEEAAAPLVRESVELAKSQGLPIVKAALGRAEAGSEKVIRAAVPFAERMLERAKTYLDKKGR